MKLHQYFLMFFILAMPFGQAQAAGNLALQKVTSDVFAIVGELGNRSPDNLGNNATFGFVITSDGVVLIDSGGSYQGAQKIDQLIKTVTDKPVVTVINSGGQDHRWLGNGYFKAQGAQIIASEAAVNDQKARSQDQFFLLGNLVGEKGMNGTDAVYAEKTFGEKLELVMGGTTFLINHAGQAHTPGDSFIWLPEQKVMFTGDIVYVERMLRVGTHSNSKSWVKVFETMAAYNPRYLIPGHGRATSLQQAKKDTFGYLTFLRSAVSDILDDGGEITDINSVDQSAYDYLLNYDTLAGRNAQQVYIEMEWE